MWKPFAVSILFGCCIFSAGTVNAITFEARNFDALASEADQIIIGTAAAASARRTGTREIVTDYSFNDLEVVKGTALAGSLKLTMLGGTVGSETLNVAGAPTFYAGIRYLVFIAGNGSVMFPLVGGHQGLFQIRRDSIDMVSRVHDHAGRPVIRLNGPTVRNLAETQEMASGDAMTEAAFVDAIRARVAEKGVL